MSIATAIEKADIEICASGFDNLVMYGDLEELQQHAANLHLLGAIKCHTVINELITWLISHPDSHPLDVLESDHYRTNSIWNNYNDASCEENPRQRAIEYERK